MDPCQNMEMKIEKSLILNVEFLTNVLLLAHQIHLLLVQQ